MTYPPQGPYGQQPDPYGQQQPDPYGQYGGGYQQQPTGQYGGYDPNAQYGGLPQYGGLGGGPQPPKKNTGPIIAVVAIVVLLLGGLGITGFVAPGFFLADDDKNTGSGGTKTSGSQTKSNGSGADDFIDTLVAAADDKDADALEELTCTGAEDSVASATKDIDEIDGASLKDTEEVSDEEVTAILSITVNGDDGDFEASVIKDDGDWCWNDISTGSSQTTGDDEPTESTDDGPTSQAPPTGGGDGGGGDSDGEEFVQSFLDKLNAGDASGANALLCPDSTSQSDVTEVAGQSPSLEMDSSGTQADSSYVGADLTGTLDGEEASGRTSAFLEDPGWCIYTFYAY